MTEKITKQDWWLLGVWVAIGFCLRFGTLGLKSVWGDEWATFVFSLGHRFQDIPLNQLIGIDVLLDPIRYDSSSSIAAVGTNLIAESNHPPLYYWLTHLWFSLWSRNGAFISIFVGRSPAAFCGVILIPLTFGMSWWVLRRRWAAHWGAIAMSISPYAVYLSQDARHYTLALVWISLSYGCLIKIIQAQARARNVALQVYGIWISANVLGIASHYFMLLCLFGESLILILFYAKDCWQHARQNSAFRLIFPCYWRRIFYALTVSGLLTFILLNHWQSDNQELTSWLNQDYGWGVANLLPPLRSLGWLLGMMFMLPVEADQIWLVILSAIALLVMVAGFVPVFITDGRRSWEQLEFQLLVAILSVNLATILGITYILKLDLTLAPRYFFICFPPLTLLLGMLLANLWEQRQWFWFFGNTQNTRLIAMILTGCLALSSLCVVSDLAYRKPENSQAIAPLIKDTLDWEAPTIFVTHYFEVAVTRTQMGMAWALHQLDPTLKPQFLLLDSFFQPDLANQVFIEVIQELTTTTQILTFNTHFKPPEEQCKYEPQGRLRVTGYSARLYLCTPN